MPSTEEPKPYLMTNTADLKMVSDYSGLDFEKAINLDCLTFKILLKDAIIDSLSKTENGRTYLEDCYILRQTKPDRKALRQQFKEI